MKKNKNRNHGQNNDFDTFFLFITGFIYSIIQFWMFKLHAILI